MTNIAYKPNLKDPRVLKRIKHAYGYARGVFSEVKEQQKSRQALEKQFGDLKNPLSQFLFNTLLTCTDQHYSESAGISKKYILNAAGAEKVREILKGNLNIIFTPNEIKLLPPHPSARCIDEAVVNAFVEREYGSQLQSLNFTYTDKSNRYWNDIQNIRKTYRGNILAKHGLKYCYDIRACAPTLLMQHAQQQNGVCFTEIESFLSDRTAYRQLLSDECELSPLDINNEGVEEKNKTAKLIINSLFCGAMLGLNNQFALSKVLDYDVARIMVAKDITANLRADIKDMWSEIKPTMSRKRNINGRLIPIQPRQKWARYFELERQVINAVRAYLTKTDNKYFLEHDGWTCEKMIDERELLAFIYKKTGYKVEVDMEENMSEIVSGVATQQPTNASHIGFVNSSSLTDALVSSSTKRINNTYITLALAVNSQVQHKSSLPIKLQADMSIDNTWIRKYLRNKR